MPWYSADVAFVGGTGNSVVSPERDIGVKNVHATMADNAEARRTDHALLKIVLPMILSPGPSRCETVDTPTPQVARRRAPHTGGRMPEVDNAILISRFRPVK